VGGICPAQALTLWRWRARLIWLPITAGVRFSDLFTDISYTLTSDHDNIHGSSRRRRLSYL
jgi:hypothetical protein